VIPVNIGLQQQQEYWTDSVIQQMQQQKLPPSTTIQKVKTERIQPYIPQQNRGMTVQQNVQAGQQVFYTLTNESFTYGNPHQQQQQQHMNMNGNGYQQSY
jgi:hypothetical protein